MIMDSQYVVIGNHRQSTEIDEELLETLEIKYTQLKDYFKKLGSVIIAFSGGVDSTLLLKVAHDTLGEKALAVTASTSTLAQRELEETKKLAQIIGAQHRIITYEEMENENYRKNPTNRCYYCKDMLFEQLTEIAAQENIYTIVEGSNYDDLGDHRPGLQAAQQRGIKSPLLELGFTKTEIRQLSAQLGLPTHNKPQLACLSSRIPYGQEITKEKLVRIDEAEEYLHNLGVKQLRVRHHDNIARIEVEPHHFPMIAKHAQQITEKLKSLGFKFVALDLEGYQRGKMNQ